MHKLIGEDVEQRNAHRAGDGESSSFTFQR